MKIINHLGISHLQIKGFVSNDPLRPSMTGVYFDLINKVMVATDSLKLLECPIEIELDKEDEVYSREKLNEILKQNSKIVPLEFFNRNKYMGDYKNYFLPLTYDLSDEIYARVLHGDEMVFQCKFIDANFPNYKAVYPENKQMLDEIGLNMDNLLGLVKCTPRKLQKAFFFEFYGSNRGVVFKNKEDYNFKGIIMPNL